MSLLGELLHCEWPLEICSRPIDKRPEALRILDGKRLLDVLGLSTFSVRWDDDPSGKTICNSCPVITTNHVKTQVKAG